MNAPTHDPNSAPQRILIVRLSHFGDLVHALPVWHAVRAAFPDAEMAFATQTAFAPLLEGIAPVIRFERNGGIRAWFDFRQAARAFAPTWTIDCQGNWKSAIAARLSGAKRRSGLARRSWREKGARWLANDFAPGTSLGPASHAMQHQLDLASHVCKRTVEADFDLRLSKAERDWGIKTLVEKTGSGTPLLMHFGRPHDSRAWPVEHFIQLARSAAQTGHRVLLLGGPAEAEIANQIPQIDGVAQLINASSLRQLASLFSAASKKPQALLVGCDSGPAHLAAACGLRVHLLHGPCDPAHTGPWPQPDSTTKKRSKGSAVHSSQSASIDLPCRPCSKRICAHAEGPICLTALEPDQVFKRLEALI